MHEQKIKEKSIRKYSKKVKRIQFKTLTNNGQVEEDLQRTSIQQIVGFPLLNFDKPKDNLKTVGFNVKIPNIRIKHRETIAPIVETFQKTSVIRQIDDFDLSLPDCSIRKRNYAVPIIKLPSFNKQEILSLDFEKRIPNIRVKTRDKIIPIYSRYNRERLRNYYKFNVKVDSKFLKHLPYPPLEDLREIKKLSEKVDNTEDLNPPNGVSEDGFIEDRVPRETFGLQKTSQKLEISQSNGDNGNGTSESKEKPLFDNLFHSKESEISDIDSGNPYVVFLPSYEDDEYIVTIWILLGEIFRKLAKKGKPKSRIHDKKQILEEELRAEDNIDIIEENGNDYTISIPTNERIHTIDKNKPKKLLGFVKNRLREMKTQGLGFIIFHVSKDLIEKIKNELNEESWKPEIIDLEPVFHKHSIQELKLVYDVENFKQEMDIDRIKKQSASCFWGFVEPVNDNKWTDGKTFDDFFGACEREFRKKLREIFKKTFTIINSEKIILKDNKKVIFTDSEGPLHKRIKVLVLKHLLDNKICKWEEIKVEQSFPDTNGIIQPDILIGDVIPYEIETFYGRGEPDDRIGELIKDYQNKTNFSKIKIVITNLDAILWYNKFMRIKKNKEKEIDVEFLTLDVKNKQLIKIEDLKSIFLKNLSNFIE